MTDRSDPARDALTGAGPDSRADVDPDVASLLGLRPVGADSVPDAAEVDELGEITDTGIYEGALEARAPDSDQPDDGPAGSIEDLAAGEFRAGETDDPNEAAEEGFTWIPPTDPPVVADARGDAVIAAGFATSADDEPFDADHHAEPVTAGDEVQTRVMEALMTNAATSALLDDLSIGVEGRTAILRGSVDDIESEDELVAVAESVPGIDEVISEIRVRGLETADERAEG
ncbi:MAG TPA: BON domain-containing protein [Candidatus Limnocylindrales bacterium]|nr:BON domain-containing protein [Candidatus Limnocylindrales bacterium]